MTSATVIDSPPEAAIIWMRSWFLPATAKPLYSLENVAELLNVPTREVLPLAAAHDIPCQRDEALGFVFSVWATRTLLMRVIRGREIQGARFDRQAMLWRLLEQDPEKAAAPPRFEEELEKELERVNKLPEPTRGMRTLQIIEAMRDAEGLAASVWGLLASRDSGPEFENGIESVKDAVSSGA